MNSPFHADLHAVFWGGKDLRAIRCIRIYPRLCYYIDACGIGKTLNAGLRGYDGWKADF